MLTAPANRAVIWAGVVTIAWAVPVIFLLVQISTLFRVEGLQSFNAGELAAHGFEIRGNEGAASEMDGIEYYRTELLERVGLVEAADRKVLHPHPKPPHRSISPDTGSRW